MAKREFFVVRESGSDSWANVFLMNDWTLYVDWTHDQHDAAMDRLGIHYGDVMVSARIQFYQGNLLVQFRTPTAYDRGEWTADEVPVFCREVREFLEARYTGERPSGE